MILAIRMGTLCDGGALNAPSVLRYLDSNCPLRRIRYSGNVEVLPHIFFLIPRENFLRPKFPPDPPNKFAPSARKRPQDLTTSIANTVLISRTVATLCASQ